MKKRRLHYHLALPVTAIIVVLLLVNIALSSSLQRKQAEDTMRDQAYILSQNMSAIWDFISVNQSRINYDRDGVYNQKGLYCSKAGLSVGALFSKRTDYIISYAALNPRSEQNRADDFETEALVAFADDPSLEEYTAFGKVRAEEGYFRYAAPLRMDGTCESCHGGIAGEIDETGYPKEGFVDGDLVGIISIATPVGQFEQNYFENALLQGVFLVVLSVGCILASYWFTQKYVSKPLGKLERAIERSGTDRSYEQLNADAIGAKGEISSLVSFFNDASKKLEAVHLGLESEVKRRTLDLESANVLLVSQAEELEALNGRLKADNRYKSHYFTMMSHELKTPLTAIIAYANILREASGSAGDLNADAIESIASNSRDLLRLIENILESAKLEAGRASFEMQVVDTDEVFYHLESSLTSLAAERNLTLSFFRSKHMPLFLADSVKLSHILENLISNAIKHTSSNGYVVIESYHCKKDETVRFRVIDNGTGIPEEEQRAIFEEFVQASDHMDKPTSGSGLGLALAKEYAELHGGSIQVKSTVGEGSIFTVVLPYVAVVSEGGENDV